MNAESGPVITIRGKGSYEPLHCLVTADTQYSVDRAKESIQEVIETTITTPERANDRKRQQLRDLAVANGTFCDDEGLHGRTNTNSNSLATASIICHICNGAGHIARDGRVAFRGEQQTRQ
ncbi:hypothetical protein GGS26DRAFT_587637 [Hypomontagnella submonticulosa]|nr:hypothetical protein GGS26DRAFT_587637 [Hypomontagnella submonticulosa]